MNDANEVTSKRLQILKQSLEKKEATFDQKLDQHFEDAKGANGQPLNDKRNGAATMSRWDKQDNALRDLKHGIGKTQQAIERETTKILNVLGCDIPGALRKMIEDGELTQWRKHPETFFVPGVTKGRIVWVQKKKLLGCRYVEEIPPAEYPDFRDAFNKARAALKEAEEKA